MKKYAKNIENRKVLVERLEELTGKKARYTFVPRCAYEIGDFTVEKDGSLTVQDGADETVIQVLKDEDMIGDATVVERPPARVRVIQAAQPAQAPVQATLPAQEWEDEDWDGGDTAAEADAEQEVWTPDVDIFSAADTAVEGAEDTVSEEEERTEEGMTFRPVDEDWVPDAEYEQEAEAESAVGLGVTDAHDSAEEEETVTSDAGGEGTFPMNAVISFPLRNHSVTTLTNLISLIYTRGPLLSKATGGVFLADKELVDAILDEYTLRTVDELREVIRDYEAQHGEAFLGFHIEEDKVVFDGFTEVPDEKHLQTYTRLAAAMNKMSLNQKRVQAKEVDQTNEKYALRIWLIRLGMNGVEYKADRKILMEKLSGHTAFRTEEEKERAKEKAIRKRDALRAIKAQAAENAAEAE